MNTRTQPLETAGAPVAAVSRQLDRESVPALPRSSSFPCPHCGNRPRDLAHHLRDTGETELARAELLGYCPVLFARRHRGAA